MAINRSSNTFGVDDQYDILKQRPSQRTLLITAGVLAAFVCILPNKKEGEVMPSVPIKQVDTETPPVQPTLNIDSSHSSSQDTALSVVNGENYLQITSELRQKQQHNSNYKPNTIELEALEWERVYNMMFDGMESKK